MLQSQATYQSKTPQGRRKEHIHVHGSINAIQVKQLSLPLLAKKETTSYIYIT